MAENDFEKELLENGFAKKVCKCNAETEEERNERVEYSTDVACKFAQAMDFDRYIDESGFNVTMFCEDYVRIGGAILYAVTKQGVSTEICAKLIARAAVAEMDSVTAHEERKQREAND